MPRSARAPPPTRIRWARCRAAEELDALDALDALAPSGTTACTVCDAAEALLPILAHGQDDVPAPGA
ncbi:hypothetical protein [Streptomyces sp. 147326]|uniref:hypothetical protein n=1 Tax=Streptomyces sp. 147326 TaxID=3074379 RepID=UPI00385794F6